MKTKRWIGTAAVMAGLAAAAVRADWTDNLTLGGDARVRVQRAEEDGKEDRDRIRFRARMGIEGRVNDDLALGLRLASGERDDLTSDNQTMGDSFNKKEFSIIRAFLDWTAADGLHVIGGKMHPEGVAATYKLPLAGVDLMANASYLVAVENKADDDVTLTHGQVAALWKPDAPFTLLAGTSLFAWQNADLLFEGDDTAYNTVEGFVQIALTTGLPLTVSAQFAVNTEADRDDTGYLIGLKLGNARAPGSFEAGYQYRRLEKYCVVAPFAESTDTGDGTDVAAHIPYLRYVVKKNVDVKLQVAMAERGLDDGHALTTWKLDFSAKF